MSHSRVIVANLDCESEMAARERGEHGSFRANLPARVLRRISGAATLLRAFALPGDVLWTPARVDESRLLSGTILPLPALMHGGCPPAADQILAWGETETIAACRASHPVSPRQTEPASPSEKLRSGAIRTQNLWTQNLWKLGAPDPAAVRHMNHRATGIELARELGVGLTQAGAIRDLAELDARVKALGPAASWIVKAPYSAAGRDRAMGKDPLTPDQQRRVESLLARHEELSFEPWLGRTADFGACAILQPDGARVLGSHRQLIDARGGFRGIHWTAGRDRAPGLEEFEHEQLMSALDATLTLASRSGYRGAMGIDAWRYVDANGRTRFHPLGEINARLSFGLVARALEERFALPEDQEMLLEFAADSKADEGVWLLEPGEGEPGILLSRLGTA